MRMTQLKTIADIQTGPFGSQLHKEDYVETGTPIVTVEHLGNRVFTEQNLPRVSDSDKARLIKYTLQLAILYSAELGLLTAVPMLINHTTDGCSRDVAYESAQLNWLILCTYIIISV